MVRGSLGKLASRALSVAGKWQHQQLRRLNVHEYQGAELMGKYGINVPRGAAAGSVQEVKDVLKNVFPSEREIVVKSQILAGGRGLGTFKSGLQGGVHIVKAEEAEGLAGMHSLAGEESAKMAALSGVTAATGPYQFPRPLNADERPEEANGAAPGPGQFPPPMDSSLILPQRSEDVVASSSGLPLAMLSDSGRQGKATKSEESTEVEDIKAATSAAPGPGQSLPPMDSSLILPHRSDDVVASSSALPLPMLSNSGEQEKAVESEKSNEIEEEAEKAEATADGAARDKGKEMAGVAAAGSRARAPVPVRKEETPALPDLNDMQAFPEIPAPVPGRSRPPKPGRQSHHSSA